MGRRSPGTDAKVHSRRHLLLPSLNCERATQHNVETTEPVCQPPCRVAPKHQASTPTQTPRNTRALRPLTLVSSERSLATPRPFTRPQELAANPIAGMMVSGKSALEAGEAGEAGDGAAPQLSLVVSILAGSEGESPWLAGLLDQAFTFRVDADRWPVFPPIVTCVSDGRAAASTLGKRGVPASVVSEFRRRLGLPRDGSGDHRKAHPELRITSEECWSSSYTLTVRPLRQPPCPFPCFPAFAVWRVAAHRLLFAYTDMDCGVLLLSRRICAPVLRVLPLVHVPL